MWPLTPTVRRAARPAPTPCAAYRPSATAPLDGVMALGVVVEGSDPPASQYETMVLRSLIKNLVV